MTTDRPVAEMALAVVDMRISRHPQASHMMADQSLTIPRPLCRRGAPLTAAPRRRPRRLHRLRGMPGFEPRRRRLRLLGR